MSIIIQRLIKNYELLSIDKKSSIWFTISIILQNAVLFLIVPIYTRILTTEEFGLFSLYQSWQVIANIIVCLALDRCVSLGFVRFEYYRNEFMSTVLTLMTILATFFAVMAFVFKDFFIEIVDLPFYILWLLIISALINNTFSVWMWKERYKGRYKVLSIFTFMSVLLTQSISVFCIEYIYKGDNNKGIILILSIILLRLIINGYIYIRDIKYYGFSLIKKYYMFALKFSFGILPHALAQVVLYSFGRIFLAKTLDLTATAYYSVIYNIAMAFNTIVISVATSIQPSIFRYLKNKDFSGVNKETKIFLHYIVLLIIGVSLIAPEILCIVAPPQYGEAINIFPIIISSIYFNAVVLCLGNVITFCERPVYISIATFVGTISNIIFCNLFIKEYGYYAAAIGIFLTYFIMALFYYNFSKIVCKNFFNFHIDYVYNVKSIVLQSIVTIILIPVSIYLYDYFYFRVFTVLFFIVIYFYRSYKSICQKYL